MNHEDYFNQQPSNNSQYPDGCGEPPDTPPESNRQKYEPIARQMAHKHGIDADMFVRQIQQESRFDPSAKSPAGACGIAQIMPGTAKDWQVDPWDPVAALDAAARAMKRYYDQFHRWDWALAAYNAGPGAVRKYNGIPPFSETRHYVKTILRN